MTEFEDFKKKVLEKLDEVLEESWEKGFKEAKAEGKDDLAELQKEFDAYREKVRLFKAQAGLL